MKILAIDSSGLVASAAVVTEEAVLSEYTTNFKKTHSETLLPMIDEVIKMTETSLSELSAIALTAGPGSFTGLRIGSATAKGLAEALDIPLIAVPTTLALSYNFAGSDALICPLMDARRSQSYTGLYRYNFLTKQMDTVLTRCAVPITEIIKKVNENACRTIFLGDGCPVFANELKELVTVPYETAPMHLSMQRASSVAAAAFAYLKAGGSLENPSERTSEKEPEDTYIIKASDFVPIYLRKSQAEREREEKEAAK